MEFVGVNVLFKRRLEFNSHVVVSCVQNHPHPNSLGFDCAHRRPRVRGRGGRTFWPDYFTPGIDGIDGLAAFASFTNQWPNAPVKTLLPPLVTSTYSR